MAGLDARSLKAAKNNRLGRLRGYGNAIVPELAAQFVGAYMDARGIQPDLDKIGKRE